MTIMIILIIIMDLLRAPLSSLMFSERHQFYLEF